MANDEYDVRLFPLLAPVFPVRVHCANPSCSDSSSSKVPRFPSPPRPDTMRRSADAPLPLSRCASTID